MNPITVVIALLFLIPNLVVACQPFVIALRENPWILLIGLGWLAGFSIIWNWLQHVHRKNFPNDPPL